MHANRRGRKRVVRRKDEGAPILTMVVGCILRPCENVVPSVALLSVFRRRVADWETYSRMLDSDGWAVMYGGGFSEMFLYSRVNWGMTC
jgi:hypothetical protein